MNEGRAMRAAGRFIKFVAFVAAVLALIGGVLWLSSIRALPERDGTLSLAGLAAPVTVTRDEHGIPLISAQSEEDAYFALGYVHAQDRLFQMEMMRRQGQGRIAELIGASGVAADKFMRTLGVYRRAEEDLRTLDPATQRAFARYAAGVNVWLSESHTLPIEFQLLFFRPEPWRPADSLVWQKLMGLQLSGNWDNELGQAGLIAKLGAARAAELRPSPRPEDPVTMSRHAHLYRDLPLGALRAAMTRVIQPTSASNAWVADGARSTTGKPIVANDPHLNFQSPIIWYFAGIDTPALKIFGATVPGVPLHMLGHNHRVGWGITTPDSDTSDLFIEQVSGDGTSYETPEGPRPFDTRTEVIRVRFGDPVAITVRETRHGPVVSDILTTDEVPPDLVAGNKVLALSAALFQPADRSADGVYRMNRATDVAGFIEAIRLFHAPQQNMMFADVDGAIGYYAPGRVPIRKFGDGSVPVPGWSGDYDWTGWIPFEELPHELSPARGILINANNKMIDDSYPHLIAAYWSGAYRAQRLEELLAGATASLETTQVAQMDIVSPMAREMLPMLLARVKPQTEGHKIVLGLLEAWDGAMSMDLPQPLLFAVWMEKFKGRILDDELGELAREFGGLRPEALRNVLTANPHWCDDVRTPDAETCEQQVAGALGDLMVWLSEQNISDPGALRWGDYHRAHFGHMLFRNFPVVSDFGGRFIPTPGDNYTVNRGSFSSSTSRIPFRHNHGASLRAIYDFSDLSRSRFALAGGQSGHMASSNYADMLQTWRDGAYFTAPTASQAVHRLILTPRNP